MEEEEDWRRREIGIKGLGLGLVCLCLGGVIRELRVSMCRRVGGMLWRMPRAAAKLKVWGLGWCVCVWVVEAGDLGGLVWLVGEVGR